MVSLGSSLEAVVAVHTELSYAGELMASSTRHRREFGQRIDFRALRAII